MDLGLLTMFVESLPDGVLVLGGDGRVELLNTSALRLLNLGRHAGEDLGNVEMLVGAIREQLADPATTAVRMARRLRSDVAVTGEEIGFADGRIVELSVIPLPGGHASGGKIVHLRDVTTKVAAARGIAAAGANAGEHLRASAEANALNNEFVSMAAHEMRAPLSAVVAFSCLMAEPGSGELTEDQRGHLTVIDRNANRLLRLIEDLLLTTRLEARTLQPAREPLNLSDLLGAALTECAAVAGAAGIELLRETEPGPDLIGDGGMLYQAIGNLLDNALRFTPRGGRITVRSSCEMGRWVIAIADTGIGIPAVDLPTLFTPFFRGSNVTGATGRAASPGAGLGLVVCRAIIELHGGAIQVASTEGIGTTVTVTLPAADAARGTGTNNGG
jgi:signal transduction histidine kinase